MARLVLNYSIQTTAFRAAAGVFRPGYRAFLKAPGWAGSGLLIPGRGVCIWSDWPAEFLHDVDWLVGAAMLVRRAALEDACTEESQDPFDEAFFMYSEELDLCRRVKLAGWRNVFVPDAVVVHYEGRSSDQAVAARHIYFNTSKVQYYQKYFGARWATALRRYLLLEFRWQLWQERAKWLVGHKRALRAQRIAAYKQVIASGLQPSS